MRMLVVEDEPVSRLLLQKILEPYGEVHVAVHGREAVEAVRTALEKGERYDLICLDIMMPELDGQAALRMIRESEETVGITSTRGAKIIMVTALDDAKTIVDAYRELCDGYLVKPVDRGKLNELLRTFNLLPQ